MAEYESLLSNIESVVTIGAIIIGGIWGYLLFIKNREKFPKADISHHIEKVEIDNGILIRLTIEIENLGKVILPIIFVKFSYNIYFQTMMR